MPWKPQLGWDSATGYWKRPGNNERLRCRNSFALAIPQAKLLVSGWRKQRHGTRHKQATVEVGRHEVARFFFRGASH